MKRQRASILVALALIVVERCASSSQIQTIIPCQSNSDCWDLVDEYSTCRQGVCSSNPFEQGCLYRYGVSNKKRKRVCNSDDDASNNAAEEGICRHAEIEYPEVRLFTQNWEAAVFETWILQIILSELLDIPTTTETGTPEAKNSFYNPHGAFDFGLSMPETALANAAKLGDCQLARRQEENYHPCAHIVVEMWQNQKLWGMNTSVYEKPIQTLGVVGQEGFFVPSYTAQRDPSLLSYLGLQGDDGKRQELAAMFLRPTTWGDYCSQVSNSSCTDPEDSTAVRAPLDELESERFYVSDLYTGHFRMTEENDCDTWPTNCTGHFMDYPCDWAGSAEQKLYHLGIPLQSSGPEPGARGYPYPRMVEIWKAANWTKSDVIGMWWSPEPLYQAFLDTDAELLRVSLPVPNQVCLDAEVSVPDRCSPDLLTRVGSAAGSCDEPVNQPLKVISKGLYRMVQDKTIPPALQSPAFDVLDDFHFSSAQLEEVFEYWLNASDPRDGICKWVVDNFDWSTELVPETYPRVVVTDEVWSALRCAALAIAILATLLALLSLFGVYKQRNRRVMIFAQVEFLFLILAGLLLLSLTALVTALPPSNAICSMCFWFGNIGYTLEFVPLLTKMAAINRLMQASRSMRKRFVLRKGYLFGIVFGITAAVMVCLTIRTIVDPIYKRDEFELSTESSSGDAVIKYQSYCSSDQQTIWAFVTVIWYCILLLCAAVLAFQTRGLRQEFNESQTLAVMIYSHCLFMVLRLINFFILPAVIDFSTVWLLHGILCSADVIATICIYFVPKFLTSDEDHRRESFQGRVSFWANRFSYVERGEEVANDEMSSSDQKPECSMCKNEAGSYNRSASEFACTQARLVGLSDSSVLQISSDDVQPVEGGGVDVLEPPLGA